MVIGIFNSAKIIEHSTLPSVSIEMNRPFFSGTSNVVLPVPNKTFFPPEFQQSSRLTYYASLFNSVEVNSTFYKLPLARTVARWAEEVPHDFRFSFKLIQTATHALKQTLDVRPIPAFLQCLDTAKRGCVLVQLPPKFTIDITQLGVLLNALENCGWPLAIEFRNPSWYTDDVFELLYQHNAAMVLHDMKKSAAPMELTSYEFVYLRFHGPEPGYRGSYTDSHLAEYASYINEWLDDGKTVYAYFNNTLGDAVGDLVRLRGMVGV